MFALINLRSVFQLNMERVLFSAIVNFIKNDYFPRYSEFKDCEERELYRKRFQKFALKKESLTHCSKGIVPSLEDLDEFMSKAHYSKSGKHIRKASALVTALTKAGFGMPKFLSGINRVVEE